MSMTTSADVGHATLLYELFIMLAAAKLFAEIFERLKQPAVVGEILAGVIIGPSVLGWVAPNATISVLAEIGVIFLLFTVGLETKPQTIFRVGMRSLFVAVLGVILPFIAGYFIAIAWGGSFIEAMFIGAAMVATSVGITARVLSGMGLMETETARVILGAAVIDDILGLIVLSLVSSISRGDASVAGSLKIAAAAIGFTLFAAIVGSRMINRVVPLVSRLKSGKPFFSVGLIICLGLSAASVYAGVAAIIGSFLAGMALAEASEDNRQMHHLTSGVTEFMVPFFLVNIGMQLEPGIFREGSIILLAVTVTLAAVVTKFVGCGIGAFGMKGREMAQVGAGMIPRGEVGIVVAQIGLGLGVIAPTFFAAVLFMAVATTLIAPPLIKMLYSESKDDGGNNDGMDEVFEDDLVRIG